MESVSGLRWPQTYVVMVSSSPSGVCSSVLRPVSVRVHALPSPGVGAHVFNAVFSFPAELGFRLARVAVARGDIAGAARCHGIGNLFSAGAFKGMGVGCLLVVIGVVGLFWNEGRTIKETRKLDEGERVVVDVDAATVEAGNDGKLIHISGDVVSSDIVSDPEFGVALNALKLTR